MKATRTGDGGKGARRGRRLVSGKRNRTVRKAVLVDGQEECPVCRGAARPRGDFHLWPHKDLWGDRCVNTMRARQGHVGVDIAAALAAEEREQERLAAERRSRERPEIPRAQPCEGPTTGDSSGPRAWSECQDCGRIVSGERRYCGPCAATRMTYRRRPA